MKLQFKYGTAAQEVEVPDGSLMGVLSGGRAEPGLTGEEEVVRALGAPIGTPRLRELVKPGETVSIVTSDITRPCPTWVVMPPVLDELYAAGVDRKDITLVFALGSHRRHTEEEQRRLAGERAWCEIRCVDSDPEDCVRLGKTCRGTPVDITRAVAQADRRICLGNVEYHYFAGYSGGAKAIMPGVSTRSAIQANHAMMTSENARAGRLAGNPVRMDIEEAADICGVDFIVNVVLDERKQIIRAAAGHVTQAHRAACTFLDGICRKAIPYRADIVLVSQGGAPKDLNLYQTQKALDNARHAVRTGGVIILIGACGEGLGESTFERWLREAQSPRDLVTRVREHFELGGHKAAAIAMAVETGPVFLVSQLDKAMVRKCFLEPFSDVQSAFDKALRRMGPNARVLAMPFGGSTLPYVNESGGSNDISQLREE